MTYDFKIGGKYKRRDVYKMIGISENTKGGNWDTGYNRHEGDWFIFCNVGGPGRTGHDYANQWVGIKLQWYGKTNTKLSHPSIKSLTGGSGDVYIFWRENNEDPFTFAGKGVAEEIEDSSPVKVIWTFPANDTAVE